MNNKDPRVKTMNPKIGGPLALILIVGFAAFFIYGYLKQSKNDKEYLANPKSGDIYYTKDEFNKYSVMRAVEVKDDEVLVEIGNFTVRDKKQLHDKDWTFSPPVWITTAELQQRFDKDEITSVVRPKNE